MKKIEELRPNVITLDLEMPGMSGLDTLREIRSRHGIPVIVVSAYSTKGAAQTLQALSLGAFDFVAKPADVAERMPKIAEELIAKIKAAALSRDIRPVAEPVRALRQTFFCNLRSSHTNYRPRCIHRRTTGIAVFVATISR